MTAEPEEGGVCPGCGEGVLRYPASENCSCHLGHAPCSSCVEVVLMCEECGWKDGDE